MVMANHRLLIEEKDRNLTSLYYRDATLYRNSSYPFISGDTFRALADHVFDESRSDKPESIKYGDIVFVKGDSFHKFFSQFYQFIDNPFVLVTHNSDHAAPNMHRRRLKEDKIIAWYASNPDIRSHEKLFPIPIGLANRRWLSGNLSALMYAFEHHRKPWLKRTTLLYVNYSPSTNREERFIAFSKAKTFQNVQIVKDRVSFSTYLEHLGNTKFVLSPSGNGLDCHRTWEALLMGAAPVVASSGLDALYKGIPAVIVGDWSNLTERLLTSKNFRSYDNLSPAVLYARYWREKLRKHRLKYS